MTRSIPIKFIPSEYHFTIYKNFMWRGRSEPSMELIVPGWDDFISNERLYVAPPEGFLPEAE